MSTRHLEQHQPEEATQWFLALAAAFDRLYPDAGWVMRYDTIEKINDVLKIGIIDQGRPLRKNGAREGVIRHLVQSCGMCEEEAEKMFPRKATGQTVRRALRPEQLRTFERAVKREVAYEPLRVALLMLPLTGCRNDEIRNALRSNLLMNGKTWILRVCGKGGKWRDIRLNRRARRLLEAYAAEAPPSRYLFPSIQTDGPMTEAVLQGACRRIGDQEPSLRGVTPHVLRHTYATEAMRRCEDLKDLRNRMGHTSMSTTLIYLHGE